MEDSVTTIPQSWWEFIFAIPRKINPAVLINHYSVVLLCCSCETTIPWSEQGISFTILQKSNPYSICCTESWWGVYFRYSTKNKTQLS